MKILRLSVLLIMFITLSCSGGDEITDAESEKENSPFTGLSSEDTPKQESPSYDNYKETVTEKKENRPPKIQKIEIETVNNSPRDGFRAVVEAVDPEGDEIDFIYQWKYNGEDLIGETDQILEWQEEFEKGNIITIEVIPYDYDVEGIWKSEGSFTIPNSPPRISSSPPGELKQGIFSYTVEANDPDGDSMDININNAPEGMTFDTESNTLSWDLKNALPGNYTIEIVVSDEEGAKTTQMLEISADQPNA